MTKLQNNTIRVSVVSCLSKFKYVARDKTGILWFYTEEPAKRPERGYWAGPDISGVCAIEEISQFNTIIDVTCFDDVSWEDKKATIINWRYLADNTDEMANNSEASKLKEAYLAQLKKQIEVTSYMLQCKYKWLSKILTYQAEFINKYTDNQVNLTDEQTNLIVTGYKAEADQVRAQIEELEAQLSDLEAELDEETGGHDE